ncbi:MAG: DUF2752 domain-containing protein [Bacteroidetes bacterium]|nr:MAG: DUF2752 domain-containing protein [Bacteroidota bacterium]
MKKIFAKSSSAKPLFSNPMVNWRVNLVWLCMLFLFPIVLWILPSNTFDATGFELCPSKLFFDVECWGCGISRAVMHLHHFEFSDALYYHSFVFIIYPLLVLIWVLWVRDAVRVVKNKPA